MIVLTALAFAQNPLDAAYQREYAHLQAELESIEARRDALERESQSRISGAQSALARAQADAVSLTGRRERAEDELFELSQALESVSEGSDRVDSTLVQASASLPGVKLPEDSDERAFELAFQAAAQRLRDGQSVTSTPGSWFREDGTRADGTIRRIGGIAAIGEGEGALAPAGEGRLVRVEGEGIFLFEGETKRAVPEEGKTWADQLEAGGVVGMVILILGALGVLLGLGRIVSIGIAAGTAKRRVVTAVQNGIRTPEALENRAAEALLAETPAIERFGTAILVIAAISPLLGLLGTVTGMIGTFEILTEFGTGDPRMLSGGISEALVTTQLGLIVAIPMLLLGNLLNRAGENLLNRLETAALKTINDLDVIDDDEPHQLAAK